MDSSYPLLCSCERNADRPALVAAGAPPVTYRELETRIAGLTAGLRGLGLAGACVGSVLRNEPETLELYMALARAGATSVPVNTRLTEREKRYIVEDAGVTTIVVADDLVAEALRLAEAVPALTTVVSVRATDAVPTSLHGLRRTTPGPAPTALDGDEDAAATIMYTSGTTGFPKGVVRSHRANVWNAVNSALGSPRTPRDVELFTLPAFGIGFLHFALAALLGGATLVLDPAFDAGRAWDLLEEHRVTRTFLAPTMIAAMLAVAGQERRDISALETVYTAYAFPERLRAAAIDRFGPRFVYMYGLTEAQLTCAAPGEFADKPTSVGRSMGLSRVRVFDPDGNPLAAGETGEIGFEGPSVMTGYHRLPDATRDARHGDWIRTGDLGRLDEAGDLHYVGRSKEMIKTGGFSVDPVEVENAVLNLESIREVAVVGVEDDHWGEAVVAFASPARGAEVTSDEVIATCRRTIAGYKVPKHVVFVDELPKNATGKVERGRLRAMYARRSAG